MVLEHAGTASGGAGHARRHEGIAALGGAHSRNPTVFLNHQRLMETEGEVPDGPFDIEFGHADIARQGKDVTIVATSIQVPRSLQAAEALARDGGIDAEVVNVRTLQPLDKATILGSVRKTGRVVVTDESHDDCGVAAGLAAIIADEGFDLLKAPIKRVSIPPVPIPYAQSMEDFVTPSPERIAATVRQLVAGR
jgi:pyruvate dehydrogenase E1 component beta subunit